MMENDNIRFSLVVATVGRFTEVKLLLDSFVEQSYKNFEVIVIDQNHDNKIDTLLKSYSLKLRLQHIRQGKLGLSLARNLGISVSCGDYIAFPDDDCVYPSNTLLDVSNYFNSNSVDFLAIMCRDTITNAPLCYTPLRTACVVDVNNVFDAITSIGLFVRKGFLGVVFDSQLGAGAKYFSCEEIDFVYELLTKTKYKGEYYPEIYVLHPSLPSDSYNKIFNNSKGHGAFAKKHFSDNVNFFVRYTILLVFLRPIGGALLSIFKLDLNSFKKYCYIFCGRVTGFLSFTITR